MAGEGREGREGREGARTRKPDRAAASEAASRPESGKVARIVVVVVAWAAFAVYVLDATSAAILIGLAALLGLMYWRTPEGEAQPRRMLGAGALLLLAGIAAVGTGPSEIGIGLTLLALLVLAFGIHTFGRLGPEEASRGA